MFFISDLMKSKVVRFILALVLLAPGVVAQQLEPSVERLRAHVAHLASEKLDGRKTGTVGAELAAEYVATEFLRYGLKAPAELSATKARSKTAAYMQPFPFTASVRLGKNNSMFFRAGGASSLDLRLGEDWTPLGFSTSARYEQLQASYVGYGIIASSLNYDDYVGVDLTNRIAIAFAGTPDGDNPHGEFARYGELRWKATAARDRGAKALLVIARDDNFKEDRLARLSNDYTSGDAGLPVAVISRNVARRILEAGGIATPLDELEQSLIRNAKTTASTSQPSKKNMSAPLSGVELKVQTEIVRTQRPASNVVGILTGSHEKLKHEAIVIGAHYDHLGRGGSGSLAAREGEIHYGADDNASGTSALLELARMLSSAKLRPQRTIIFAAFSGEEEGLIGSNYYVNHPVVPLAETVAMINLDMIGRLKESRLSIGGVGTSEQWREWINTANARSQFSLSLSEDGFGPSDHSSFYAKQIPVLFFWTGTHEDYHKPSDTAEKINTEGHQRVAAFVYDIVQTLDRNHQRPTYLTSRSSGQGRSTGFRVYLGTIPSYADSSDGLKLDGVREDSPAARSGLKSGDRITKLAGRTVRNVYDYTYALAEMKANEEYQVEVVREGQGTITLNITPAARK